MFNTLFAVSTPITISSGWPRRITIYAAPFVNDNQDGTISMDVSALVRDLWGNPVENGTGVFFTLTEPPPPPSGVPDFGTICGNAFTGDPLMGTNCDLATGSEIKGVAHSKLTWVAEGIWELFAATAEVGTNTGTISDTLVSIYPAVEGVTIDVSIVPSVASEGDTGIVVTAEYTDGALFSNPISDQTLTFISNNPAVADFSGACGGSCTTDINGFAERTDLDVIAAACDADFTVSIIVADPPFEGTADLTVLKVGADAEFSIANAGGLSMTYTDTSTNPVGLSSVSWSWSSIEGGTNHTKSGSTGGVDDFATFTYSTAGTYPVELIVTNDSANSCQTSITKDVPVP